MYELDDLATYDGETEHDMWVDFSTNQYTGDLEDIFDNSEINSNDFINSLDDWD